MPVGSDEYYEFNAISMNSSNEPGRFEIECGLEDRKYLKWVKRAKVMLVFGILFPDGKRLKIFGFVESSGKSFCKSYVCSTICQTADSEIIYD